MIFKEIAQSKIKASIQAVALCLSVFMCTYSYALLETLTVSGGLSQTLLEIDIVSKDDGSAISAVDANLSQKYSGRGFGLGVSFDVYRWMSMELTYNSMGKSQVTSHDSRVRESGDIQYQGASLYAVYSYPQRNHGFQVHGKLGFFSLAQNTQLDYVSQSNNTGVSVGGAVSYFNRLGWGGQFNANIHSSKLQVFSFVISRRFSLVTVETKLADSGANVNTNLRGATVTDSNVSNLLSSGASGGASSGANFSVINNEEVLASTNDDDGDGVSNDRDICPSTPLGAQVDIQGCLSSEQESDFINIGQLIDNTLLYPDDELLDEDENFTFDSLGDEEVDRVVPVGLNTLRTLIGNRRESEESFNLDDFFAGTAIQSPVANTNDGLTAEDIFGIKESEIESNSEDNVFFENGRQAQAIDRELLSVTSGFLRLANVEDLDALVEDSDPFEVSEKEKLRNQRRVLVEQTKDITESDIDKEFADDIQQLREEIQQRFNQQKNSTQEQELSAENQATLAAFSDNSVENQNIASEFDTAPVIFDEGASDLSGEQQQYLEQIANQLRSNFSNRIEIKVWRQSAEQESQDIAQRQATAVKNFLLENGVSRNQIDNIAEFETIQVNSAQANQVSLEIIE